MKRAFFLISSVALMLSACGGSDSSAPAPTVPPVVTATPLVITTANAKPAARVAYGSTMQSAETGDLVGGAGIASSPNGGFQKPGVQRGLAGLIAASLQKTPVSETVDCGPTGTTGTQTITYDFANLGTLTAGDTIFIEAMDCDEGLGEILNGRIEMTVAVFSGDILFTGLYLLDMDVVLVDFEVATATDTILSNGDSLVSIDTTGNPVIFMAISGMSMATVTNTNTDIVTNFDTSQSVDVTAPPEPYTLSASGTVDSTQIDGVISYATTSPFMGLGGAYPFQGTMVITGANGGTVTLIAQPDGITVTIETDADGDGTPESTEDTTWDDIAT
jgi:hypothetical protein